MASLSSHRPRRPRGGTVTPGWAAGPGLFSQPQPKVTRLLDLQAFGWTPGAGGRRRRPGRRDVHARAARGLAAVPRVPRARRHARPAVLPRAARLVQGAQRRHRRRQHLPVAARRADDLARRRAGRGRAAARPRRGPPRRAGRRLRHRRRPQRAAPRGAAHARLPADRAAVRADGVPPAVAVPRRPVGGAGHRPPRPRRATVVTVTASTPRPVQLRFPAPPRPGRGPRPRWTRRLPGTSTTCTATRPGARP